MEQGAVGYERDIRPLFRVFRLWHECNHPAGPGPPPSRGPYFAAFPPGITNSTTTLRSRG